MRFLLFLIVLILFTGCTPPIQEGEIYSKQFHPAWSEEVYSPIKISHLPRGKPRGLGYAKMFSANRTEEVCWISRNLILLGGVTPPLRS